VKEKEVIALFGPGNPWRIAVLENSYPAVSLENEKAFGKQELIIETPDHSVALHELHEEEIAAVFEAYGMRMQALAKTDRIEYILIFKNEGFLAGASMDHAHSQLFATQFIPPQVMDHAARAQEYRMRRGSCVYCNVIQQESAGERMVFEDAHTVAFAPYASRYMYELWISPKRHLDTIAGLSNEEKRSMAGVLKRALKAVVKKGLAYNFYFDELVHDENQHFLLRLLPQGNFQAGLGVGAGLLINEIAPEAAAVYYREQF
jgi:UDPglucose--hexose-1-phosphate uridylyltransferase